MIMTIRNTKQFLASSVLGWGLALILCLSACDKEKVEKKTPDPGSASLTSAWQVETVTVDGVDQTAIYAGFRIAFDAKTYTSINGSPIFAPSGTWVFANEAGTRVVLDGFLDTDIKFVTDDILELSLQWDQFTFEVGRTKSVWGRHVFKLNRLP